MGKEDIELKYLPEMENALLIACFDGWGNALEVSKGMAEFLIKEFNAEPFGKMEFEPFYVLSEKRPIVTVEEGILTNLEPPVCEFYAVKKEDCGRDMIILKGIEPDIQWVRYTDNILSLCRDAGVKTVTSCAGMLDNVLHTDTFISVVASNSDLINRMQEKKAQLINYKGQSSIHSTLHYEAKKQGFDCLSLYCHCPYYLQGVTHFGLLAYLCEFYSEWAGFEINTESLSFSWKGIEEQIQDAIENNPELMEIVSYIKKSRIKGKVDSGKKNGKVVKLEDYLKI